MIENFEILIFLAFSKLDSCQTERLCKLFESFGNGPYEDNNNPWKIVPYWICSSDRNCAGCPFLKGGMCNQAGWDIFGKFLSELDLNMLKVL